MDAKKKVGRPATTGTSPIRSIRIGDADWKLVELAAAARGISVPEYVRGVLLHRAALDLLRRQTARNSPHRRQ